MLKKYTEALKSGEDFLLKRLYIYAHEAEYTRYISTREEDWRIIIKETSRFLIDYLENHPHPDPLHVDDDFQKNPAAGFGIIEAKNHRKRGVSLEMFLGLLKLVQQSFSDLIYEADLSGPETKSSLSVTRRFFDKFELGFCSEWASWGESEKIREMQDANLVLTNEKNRFFTIYNSIAEPAYVVDHTLTIVNVNKALASFLAKPDADLVGKKCRDVFGFGLCESCPIKNAIENKTSFSGIETTIDVNGQAKTILVNGSHLDDISGRNTGGIVIFSDISERRKSEKHIEEQQKKYQLIAENTSDFIWIFDIPAMRVTYASPAVKRITGFTEQERVNSSLEKMLPPESMEILMKILSIGLKRDAEGENHETLIDRTEWQEYHKDGHRIWIEGQTAFLRDDKGKPIAVIGASRDITQRKKDEEDLRRSEERIRSLITHNVDAIVVVDHSGLVQYVNPAAEALFGIPAEKLMNSAFGFPMGKDEGAELDILCRDGSEKAVEMRVSETKWEGKDVYLASLRDVTERKTAEVERQQMQEQLRQVQKMEALGTLSGGIAHDFNNILSAIIGYSELGRDLAGKDSKIGGYLEEVLNGGKRATRLVQQILAFSRQADLEFKPFMVKFQVKEALNLLRATLPTSIKIVKYAECDALVMGDPTQIHQILMNLCANAAHAMRETGGTLEVRLSEILADEDLIERVSELKPGKYVKLTVKDTGCGMEAAVMEGIFDPYFTTKGKGEGTGLGLAVVHGIVTQHNGAVTVQSKKGEGTTFDVYLPAVEAKSHGEDSEDESLPDGHGETILYVDDEASLVKIAKVMLERLGYKVRAFISSKEALEYFRTHPDDFDMVITDMTMPEITGEKLALEVTRIRPDMPVLVCTGHSEILSKDRLPENSGISGIIMKPIRANTMAKAIRNILDGK